MADDEPCGQHDPLGRPRRVLEQRPQDADRFHAHLPDRLLDSRERWRDECRLRDVVEADDRQIARYLEPACSRRGHDRKRHPVVGREDRRRPPLECQQPVRRLARRLRLVAAFPDEDRVEGDSCLLERLPVSASRSRADSRSARPATKPMRRWPRPMR